MRILIIFIALILPLKAFAIDNIWTRVNYLVPDPKCSTHNGEIKKWDDNRQQPTEAELLAVDVDSVINNEKIAYTLKHTKADEELSAIAGMSYEQLNTYMDNNDITNPALRKLFIVNLAILKKMDWSE